MLITPCLRECQQNACICSVSWQTSQRLSTECGTMLYFLNYPPSDPIPLSVLSSHFFSDWSIAAVVDGHCSNPKTINSGVLQGSVLSLTLFLMFINDLFTTSCSVHSFADDTTLHRFTSFNSRPNLQDLHNSRLEAAERLTSDHVLISEWGRRNFVCFDTSTTQHDLLHSYPLFFNNTAVLFVHNKRPWSVLNYKSKLETLHLFSC